MEFRISVFVKWFSAFMLVWYCALLVDELLPVQRIHDTVMETYMEQDEMSDRVMRYYYVRTENNKELEVNATVFSSVKKGFRVDIYRSPWFRQMKQFDVFWPSGNSVEFGDSSKLRIAQVLTSALIILLCGVSLVFLKRFEHRVSVFFFAALIAGVRWWILGT